MSEEEIFKTLEKACILDKNCYEVDCLLEKDLIAIRELIKLYKNQQKEIEEKTTILLAGAEKVKQLEKEIILLKIEKLRAMKLYKECHLSQIPDTANIYYSMKLELEAIDEEISNLMRIWEHY